MLNDELVCGPGADGSSESGAGSEAGQRRPASQAAPEDSPGGAEHFSAGGEQSSAGIFVALSETPKVVQAPSLLVQPEVLSSRRTPILGDSLLSSLPLSYLLRLRICGSGI